MSKLGKRLIKAVGEARAIARGEANPATYRVGKYYADYSPLTPEEISGVKIIAAFDMVKGEWFVWEPRGIRVKARSLAELQRKLPAGAEIEGYWPRGFPKAEARRLMAEHLARDAQAGAAIATAADAASMEAEHERLKGELRAAGKIL